MGWKEKEGNEIARKIKNRKNIGNMDISSFL